MYRASFCDPLKADVIEMGEIARDKIMETFRKVPWADHLAGMKRAKKDDIYYSPSLEIENADSGHGIMVSAVGELDDYVFYIFYRRPKLIAKRTFFGRRKVLKPKYTTEALDRTQQDAAECFEALVRGDYEYLDNAVK